MGKGEIARNEQFLLFPLCFLPVWKTFCHFHQTRNCHLQTLSVWKSLKFVVMEKVKRCLKYFFLGKYSAKKGTMNTISFSHLFSLCLFFVSNALIYPFFLPFKTVMIKVLNFKPLYTVHLILYTISTILTIKNAVTV